MKCHNIDNEDEILLWDRKEEGGFPELKEVKQRLRDIIDPDLFLGHSDTSQRREDHEDAASAPESLMVIFIGAVVVLPVIVAYSIFVYRVFGGKTQPLEYY